MNRSAARLIVVLVMLLSFGVLAPAAQATFPGKNGKIAAWYRLSGNYPDNCGRFLYAANPDGTGQSVLAGGQPVGAAWSPDGRRAAIETGPICGARGSTFDLVNPDGTGSTTILDENTSTGCRGVPDFPEAAWQRDGHKLVLTIENRCNDTIATVNRDGSGLQVLPSCCVPPKTAAFDGSPSWSPDGSKIAYSRLRNTTLSNGPPCCDIQTSADIVVMNADGSDQTRISGPLDHDPVWSPTGDEIAFVRDRTLYVMRSDGTQQVPVGVRNDAFGTDQEPRWSPDGAELVFTHTDYLPDDRSTSDIFRVKHDGSALRRLTNQGNASSPVWSPDGERIAFSALYQVHIMSSDGSLVVAVPNAPGLPSDWQTIPGPRRSDYKNSNQFCKAEQAFWGDQFSQRYRNFGACVSGNT
jgi:WD40-like Beta Propeller Repeat